MSKNNKNAKRNFETKSVKKETTLPPTPAAIEKVAEAAVPAVDDVQELEGFVEDNKAPTRDELRVQLAEGLSKAATSKNTDQIRKASQDIYDAGFELEEMRIPHSLFVVVCNTLSMSGFSPVRPDQVPEKTSEFRDPHL